MMYLYVVNTPLIQPVIELGLRQGERGQVSGGGCCGPLPLVLRLTGWGGHRGLEIISIVCKVRGESIILITVSWKF